MPEWSFTTWFIVGWIAGAALCFWFTGETQKLYRQWFPSTEPKSAADELWTAYKAESEARERQELSFYWLRRIAVWLITGSAWILAWPIFIASFLWQHYFDKPNDHDVDYSVPDGLTFQCISGVGELVCGNCGIRTPMVSFEHGAPGQWCNSGYQCQSCFRLHTIKNDDKLEELPKCGCGGGLSRDATIRCPVCRSKEVGFDLEYIT